MDEMCTIAPSPMHGLSHMLYSSDPLFERPNGFYHLKPNHNLVFLSTGYFLRYIGICLLFSLCPLQHTAALFVIRTRHILFYDFYDRFDMYMMFVCSHRVNFYALCMSFSCFRLFFFCSAPIVVGG